MLLAWVANKVNYMSSEVWVIVPHHNSVAKTVLSCMYKYLVEPFNHWFYLWLWQYYFPLHVSIISRLKMGDYFGFITKLSCAKFSWVSMIPILQLQILELSFLYPFEVQWIVSCCTHVWEIEEAIKQVIIFRYWVKTIEGINTEISWFFAPPLFIMTDS